VRLQVKICGITSREDAALAIAAGADYLGILLRPSPRRVTWEAAVPIVQEARRGPHVVRVMAVLSHPDPDTVTRAAAMGFDGVQLHGDESPAEARALAEAFPALEIWKAVSVRSEADLQAIPDYGVDALVLESGAGGAGGTGRRVPVAHEALRRFATARRCLLAGGLRPEAVGEIVRRVRPWGVDVSSGVEREVGRKDEAAMEAFVAGARAAEAFVHEEDR